MAQGTAMSNWPQIRLMLRARLMYLFFGIKPIFSIPIKAKAGSEIGSAMKILEEAVYQTASRAG